MSISCRLNYYRRIFAAYLTAENSQLTFWHEVPEVNERALPGEIGEYYLLFRSKSGYAGPYDRAGVPLLNYHGALGLQYNPIAVAQYGLANYNLYKRTGASDRLERCVNAADWLVQNLEKNHRGLWVWHHHFNWEYRTVLRAPWYSALAQGQGISLLVRLSRELGRPRYLETAARAFEAFHKTVQEGGMVYVDDAGRIWLEEYIVSPPTHILNGFIWALWGVYDFFLAAADPAARDLFAEGIRTLMANLHRYDTGSWSLYDMPGTRIQNRASPYYHPLHIVQLMILSRLTGQDAFRAFADRWQAYQTIGTNRLRALAWKSAFKLLYY